jgi:hypothetical protein
MDRAAAELFLATLFTETTPERSEVVRNAAQAARNWEGLLPAVEGHGVLGLFLRNLDQAGVEIPPAVAPAFRARAGEQQIDDQRTRHGLQRFLAAAARERVEATLAGNSALCFDLHPPSMRRLGEPELLVAPEHLGRALQAGEEAGLLRPESSLPAWWFRRTATAIELVPSSPVLRPIRLRCTLHHPSLCLTVREPEVLARRRRVSHEGHPLFLLDPLDGLLELATRIASRAGETVLVGGRRHLLAAAGSSDHPLQLDCLLDVRTLVEARHATLPLTMVLARAKEWSAEPALRAVLDCLQMGLGLLPGAREWVRSLLAALAAATPARAPGSLGPALFRPDPIERLPQWIWPPDAFFARRDGAGSVPATVLRLARARQVFGVLGAAVVAGIGLPLALLQRRAERSARRSAWARAQTPQRMSDVNEAWRAAARVEQQKPIAPRTIALPPREEGALRFPDHYKG